ncbi:MAG: hypothetical protein H0W96_10810, partial [Solirubrobacterales bacterium]|nr:hypothetical protein [Solirubrobacterales bacterium]
MRDVLQRLSETVPGPNLMRMRSFFVAGVVVLVMFVTPAAAGNAVSYAAGGGGATANAASGGAVADRSPNGGALFGA